MRYTVTRHLRLSPSPSLTHSLLLLLTCDYHEDADDDAHEDHDDGVMDADDDIADDDVSDADGDDDEEEKHIC